MGIEEILTQTVNKDKKIGKQRIINTRQIRTEEGTRPWVIQIPLANFYKHLGLGSDSVFENETETSAEEGVSAPVKTRVVDEPEIIIPEENDSVYDMIMGEMEGVL